MNIDDQVVFRFGGAEAQTFGCTCLLWISQFNMLELVKALYFSITHGQDF